MELIRYTDFATEPIGLEGDKISIDKILNIEIVVTGFRLLHTKYPDKNKSGKALQLQFKIFENEEDVENTNPNVLFTGSDVLIDQITRYGDNIPFLAKIVKINRYYSFS